MSILSGKIEEIQNMNDDLHMLFENFDKDLEKWENCDRGVEENHSLYYSLVHMLEQLKEQVNLYEIKCAEYECLEIGATKGYASVTN